METLDRCVEFADGSFEHAQCRESFTLLLFQISQDRTHILLLFSEGLNPTVNLGELTLPVIQDGSNIRH